MIPTRLRDFRTLLGGGLCEHDGWPRWRQSCINGPLFGRGAMSLESTLHGVFGGVDQHFS